MKYKIILSNRGREIYKGGNIEVIKPLLDEIIQTKGYKNKIIDRDKAESILYKFVMEKMGSASINLFSIEEIKNDPHKVTTIK